MSTSTAENVDNPQTVSSNINNLPTTGIDIINSLIGPNKVRYSDHINLGGILQPPPTREELIIHKAMENCAAKATLSFILGKTTITFQH